MRPDEHVMTGGDLGPGQDSSILQTSLVDDRFERLLEYFVQGYSDEESAQLLNEIRNGGGQPALPSVMSGAGGADAGTALLGTGTEPIGPPPGEPGGEDLGAIPAGAGDLASGGSPDDGDLDSLEEFGDPLAEETTAPPSDQGTPDPVAAAAAAEGGGEAPVDE